MSAIKFINSRILRLIAKLRLRPIRVFCFHHVSDEYNPLTMWEEDWTQTDLFKRNIRNLKEQGYTFILLSDAQKKLKRDWFRREKYAVLTADDGFKSLLNILPWLEEQHIPITLFVNPKYIMEDRIGENIQNRLEQNQTKVSSGEIYLKMSDILSMQSPSITFAYHGYEHLDEWDMNEETFTQNLTQCIEAMQRNFPNVIPFYAHTYGHAKREYDAILHEHGLTPVYVSGNSNYNDALHIDRELVSNERLLKGLL